MIASYFIITQLNYLLFSLVLGTEAARSLSQAASAFTYLSIRDPKGMDSLWFFPSTHLALSSYHKNKVQLFHPTLTPAFPADVGTVLWSSPPVTSAHLSPRGCVINMSQLMPPSLKQDGCHLGELAQGLQAQSLESLRQSQVLGLPPDHTLLCL